MPPRPSLCMRTLRPGLILSAAHPPTPSSVLLRPTSLTATATTPHFPPRRFPSVLSLQPSSFTLLRCFGTTPSLRLPPPPGYTDYEPRQSPPTAKDKKERRFQPALFVLLAVPLLCGYLAVWQIERLKWKVELIDELEMNLLRPPLRLPDVIDYSLLPEFNYRKVLITGRWPSTTSNLLPQAGPILIGPRILDGEPGYHLFLPFFRSPSDPFSPTPKPILVNAGFVLKSIADKGVEHLHLPEGEVTIEAMMRTVGKGEHLASKAGKKPNMFTPDNQPDKGEWFWPDARAMAEYYSSDAAGEVLPVMADVVYDGDLPRDMLRYQGVPVGRPAKIELRNQHLVYALTWASISIVTSGLWLMVLRKGAKVKPVLGRMGQ